jgi:hypothetical protein
VRYRRRAGVSATEVDDDLFLAEPDSGATYYLDTIAAAIWDLLEEPCTRADLVEAFTEVFPDVPRERLNEDLDYFLDEMVTNGLVVADP